MGEISKAGSKVSGCGAGCGEEASSTGSEGCDRKALSVEEVFIGVCGVDEWRFSSAPLDADSGRFSGDVVDTDIMEESDGEEGKAYDSSIDDKDSESGVAGSPQIAGAGGVSNLDNGGKAEEAFNGESRGIGAPDACRCR